MTIDLQSFFKAFLDRIPREYEPACIEPADADLRLQGLQERRLLRALSRPRLETS
jgi:hypothetical protein